jgi:4-nitrophenyl phosphatase
VTPRGVVLDLDGTIYRGNDPLPGAREAVGRLRERDVQLLFLSNNPTETPSAYAERLAEMGIEADPGEIASAGSITTEYLVREHPEDPILLIGAPGLRSQFEAAGLSLIDEWREAAVLVASYDREFDYERLTEALWTLDTGATFVGTDPDLTVPHPSGRPVPGSGAIIGAIARVAGRDPGVICGKPSAEARTVVDRRFGASLEECLIVGDRLDTDIALGARCGMETALVLTGVTERAALAGAELTPDHVLESISDLDDVLGGPSTTD